jgi:hypothetical protein
MNCENVTEFFLNGCPAPVLVENWGEHHMGAYRVEIVPPFPICGISRFHTTNGRAYYSQFTNSLVIYDATTVLRIDLPNNEPWHLDRPDGWYFSAVHEDAEGYHLGFYDGQLGRDRQCIPRETIAFEPGFGGVHNGVFPSAYIAPSAPTRPPRWSWRWFRTLFAHR